MRQRFCVCQDSVLCGWQTAKDVSGGERMDDKVAYILLLISVLVTSIFQQCSVK